MIDTEGFTIVGESTAITEPAAVEMDETYYWADNIKFSVEGVLFRVSRYPFVLGSQSFSEKYGLLVGTDEGGRENIAQLEGVTAAQFRVFLKFMHLTSTTSTFTKEEWLTILTLSVKWHFHEARKLAAEHLDSLLTDIELILVGRAAYVPRWVVQGYHALIDRPLDETITEEEGDVIGHREVNRLWAVRCHQLALMPPNPGYVARELSSKFSKELADLAALGEEHRTKAEIEEEEKLEEERRKYDEEVERQLREREELEQERARIEEEEERQRIEDEEAQRLWFEEEARKIQQGGVDYDESPRKEEGGRVADEREREWASDESEGRERSIPRIASGPLAFALTKKRLTPEELERWRGGREEEMEERRRSGLEWLARLS